MRRSVENIINGIATADAEEMDLIIKEVLSWHEKAFPDQELVIWSLPKNNVAERDRQINTVAEFLHRHMVPEKCRKSHETIAKRKR